MPVSSAAVVGDTTLISTWNLVRDDCLGESVGHIHDGSSNGAKLWDRGLLAARPAAGQIGFLYKETDVGSEDIERDNGASYDSFVPADAAAGVGSARTLGPLATQASAGNHGH